MSERWSPRTRHGESLEQEAPSMAPSTRSAGRPPPPSAAGPGRKVLTADHEKIELVCLADRVTEFAQAGVSRPMGPWSLHRGVLQGGPSPLRPMIAP
jgi:hypothetical protein